MPQDHFHGGLIGFSPRKPRIIGKPDNGTSLPCLHDPQGFIQRVQRILSDLRIPFSVVGSGKLRQIHPQVNQLLGINGNFISLREKMNIAWGIESPPMVLHLLQRLRRTDLIKTLIRSPVQLQKGISKFRGTDAAKNPQRQSQL